MPPKSKPKARKSKGAVTAPKKESHRGAKRAQALSALQQDLVSTEEELTRDELLTDPLQGMAKCLDNMMAMLLELSLKVHGMDKAATEQTGIPPTSLSGHQPGRKGARHQESIAGELRLVEMVHQRAEQRLKQFPLLVEETTRQENSSSGEE